MYKCKYCNKEFEKAHSLAAHVSMCRYSPKFEEAVKIRASKLKGKSTTTQSKIEKFPEKYIKKDFIIICPRCGKEFVVNCTQNEYNRGEYRHYCSIKCAHSRTQSEETKQKIKENVKSSEIYQKNNNIAIQNRIKKYNQINHSNNELNCKYCNQKFKQIRKEIFCSESCKSKYLHQVLSKCGGFKEGSVKNYKSGWFKGIHCDSSWELAFLIYHFDKNIKVERCKEVRHYIDVNGNKHEFHPDFVINGQIYEIKGLQDINYINKFNYNRDIKFLFKKDIQIYLDYVINTYGDSFTNLYEIKDK